MVPNEKKPSQVFSERFPSTDLDSLNSIAKLQDRVDRKYILPYEIVNSLLNTIDVDGAVLEIDGERSTRYQSTYFDTPELKSHRDAAYRKRPRFKARTRHYISNNTGMLEVKLKDGRGKTIKHRCSYDIKNLQILTEEAKQFIDSKTKQKKVSEYMNPTLTSRYQRMTIVDRSSLTRLTCDEYLACTDWLGNSVSLGFVILETKSSGHPSPFDKWLWEHHHRPIRISKYCTALAVLHPELPANKWHRTIKDFFIGTL
jgi:hypothetical protein